MMQVANYSAFSSFKANPGGLGSYYSWENFDWIEAKNDLLLKWVSIG